MTSRLFVTKVSRLLGAAVTTSKMSSSSSSRIHNGEDVYEKVQNQKVRPARKSFAENFRPKIKKKTETFFEKKLFYLKLSKILSFSEKS